MSGVVSALRIGTCVAVNEELPYIPFPREHASPVIVGTVYVRTMFSSICLKESDKHRWLASRRDKDSLVDWWK